MEFTVETVNTLEEYRRFNLTLIMREQKVVRNMVIAYALFLFGGVTAYHMGDTLIPGILLAVMLVYPLVLWFTFQRSVRKTWDSNAVYQNAVNRYTFTENRVDITTANAEQHIEYDKLYRLVETKTNFYIMIARNQGFIINKADCTQEQCALIRERCGK